jgi:hypothetical protein
MTISRQEVDQMANFMRALNGTPSQPVSGADFPTGAAQPAMYNTSNETATQDMKLILERFYAAADGAVNKVNEEAIHDRSLREALVTERTDHGSRVGDWEIQVREEGKRKYYDVVQTEGSACIASDLLLYEAAYGLVRILNEGGKLNSREAINLLRYEQSYASAVNDAVRCKHYLVKNPKDVRTPVFEAKYSAAKQRAITARDLVNAIADQY